MKKITSLVITLALSILFVYSQADIWQGPSVDFSHGKLKISDNQRYIVHEDGTPFFIWRYRLGTFHRLNKDESEKYLETAVPKASL